MKKGFTLIELLIVVAIIAILAAIAVPNFLEAQVRSKVSRAKADMRSVATALESYYVDNNAYPPDGQNPLITGLTYPLTYMGSTIGSGWFSPAHLNNFLTTPIAYVSSADFIDPFNQESASNSVRTYRYINFHHIYGQSSDTTRQSVYPKYDYYCGKWQLLSNGPNKKADTSDPAYGMFWVVLRYDPTNGTVSPGDIVRTQKAGDGALPAPQP